MNKKTLVVMEKILLTKQISLSQLTEDTSLTRRQILYQIDLINNLLKDSVNLSKEYLLQSHTAPSKEALSALEQIYIQHNEEYIFNQEEREFYIFLSILSNRDYLTIYHLTDELSVGKTTIASDIKLLKEALELYHISVESNRTTGYILQGNAVSILDYLLSQIGHINAQVITVFCHYHALCDLQNYSDLIRQLFVSRNMVFVENRLEKFVYFLAILLVNTDLLDQLDFTLPDALLCLLPDLNEYRFAIELFETIGIPLTPENLVYITAVLIGISTSDIQMNTPDREYILSLLDQVMLRFQALSGLEYTEYDKAVTQLYSHFRPAVYRCIFHLPAANPLTDRILEEYAPTAKLIRETLKPLQYILNAPFSQEEIAYLTIHFTSLSTRRTYGKLYQKRCVIICNAGTGFSALLRKQLSDLFPEFIFYTSSYALLSEKWKQTPFDAIFSTSLKFKLAQFHVPVFYLPSLLTPQDKYLLSQEVYQTFIPVSGKPMPAIHDLITIINSYAQISSESRLRNDLIQYFSTNHPSPKAFQVHSLTSMLSPELIQTNLSAADARTAILLSIQPLLDFGYILPEYVKAVLENVNKSDHHTVIMQSVALPHAAPDKGVLFPGITISILKEAVPFGASSYDPVKYIFCLCATDYDSHIDVMAKMLDLLESREFYQILDSQNSTAIYSYIQKNT